MTGIPHKNMIFVFNFILVNTSILHIPLAIIFSAVHPLTCTHTHVSRCFLVPLAEEFSALYTSHLPCHAYWLNDSACWKVLGEILILKWKPSHLLMPVSLWSECAIRANGSGQKEPCSRDITGAVCAQGQLRMGWVGQRRLLGSRYDAWPCQVCPCVTDGKAWSHSTPQHFQLWS